MSIFATALLMFVMQTAPLHGIVFKKGTGEPLSDATVELRQDQENGALLKKLTSDEDGRFSFDNIAPGRYRVTVSRRGYTRPPLTVIVSAQGAGEIQLPMAQTGTISGRISDPSGQPLGNVEVLAMRASYPNGSRILTPVQSVISNDLGEYRLFWLAPGRYYVSAIHSKAQGRSRQMFGIGMGIISASTTDPAIGVTGEEGERYAPVFLGGSIDEGSAMAVDVRPASDVGGANITLAPLRLRHVRGVVTDGLSGKPAQYATLTINTSDQPRGREFAVDRERGTFDLLLVPGTHTVNAVSASGEGSATFQLLDSDIENLVVPTTPAFEMTGRVVVEGEANGRAFLESLRLGLRHDPPREEPAGAELSYSAPLPDGSFFVSAPAGNYRLHITRLQNAYVKSIRLGNADVLNAPLHLEGKPSGRLEVVISSSAGSLDGEVVTNRQERLADANVVLVPDVRRRNELYRTTTTDASGRFHLDRIPPGGYKVFAWEEAQDEAWFDSDFMRGVENRGSAVRVEEGGNAAVRVEAIP